MTSAAPQITIITAGSPTYDQDASQLPEAAVLLEAFNLEYDDPTPDPEWLHERLVELIGDGRTDVVTAREHPAHGSHREQPDQPDEYHLRMVGLAVLRVQPGLWSSGLEGYLAEIYVVPDRRESGVGSALMDALLNHARHRGVDYMHLATSEDDVTARYLYAKHGFRRTEGGPDGPIMYVYEREF